MNNQASSLSSDETKLLELFSTLWQQKIKIILITLIFMIISLIYAFNATEKWTVSATIDTPTSKQVKQYNLNRAFVNKGIKALNENTEIDTKEKIINITTNNEKQQGIKYLPDINALHKTFISEARMITNQVNFLKIQPLFKKIVADKQLDQIEQNNFAYEWIEDNISFVAENKKKINFNNQIGTNISISAIKPADALVLNRAYLNFINDIMMERTRDQITSELALAIQQVVNYEESYVNHEKVQLEKKIYTINQDIKIAKKANIKNFVTQDISLQSAPEYAKGYEILAAEKFVLVQQLESYDTHSAAMSNNALRIKKWRNFNTKLQLDDFNFYRFTDEPSLPETQDKPKRALIILLGLLVGLMVSITYVLVSSAVSHNNKTKDA